MADLSKFRFTREVADLLANCKNVVLPKDRSELMTLTFGSDDADYYEVSYDVGGKSIIEATVARCKNGAVVNYTEDYMRRRDPDALVVADDLPSDKPLFKDTFKKEFTGMRQETFAWLAQQELILMPFMSGGKESGYPSILVAPSNAAFFACGLANLQEFVNIDEWEGEFAPTAAIFLAPSFRHTHLNGKQVVVHNRTSDLYEMFSYNLYPGPSAKKGVFSVLLDVGEREGWVTAHAAAVKVISPYDTEIVLMHEGASGGGKSEMGENIHREPDGRIVMGENLVNHEKVYLHIDPCELRPVADDMVLCHPSMQNESGKLVIRDAEDGWFLRVDHIKEYGTEPFNEKIFTQPSEPLVFLNIQGVPNSTALVWEHTLDSDGKPCPNPRVILPRRLVKNVVSEPVEVDVRSFGVRTPPCTAKSPSYGILGLVHFLPPALGWLWRLVAPRGYNNPSIIDTHGKMVSEGVGSYWPFATGKMVNHANLLLEQVLSSLMTRYVLIPNQHIGCYKVGFMPQWIVREYLARRGSAKFKMEQLRAARLPLLGYGLEHIRVDGQDISKGFLRPETQTEMGIEGYDRGAKILTTFFKEEIAKFDVPELHPIGKKILDCCNNDAPLEAYLDIIPMRY